MGIAVQITRHTPFVLFGNFEKLPPILDYLGKVLPAAMMGMLVVYCLKDMNVHRVHELVPTVCAAVAIVIVHLYKKNTILSIFLGTAVYMILLRVV